MRPPHGRRTDEEGREEAMPAPFRTWTGLGLVQASDQLEHNTGLTMLSQSGSTPGKIGIDNIEAKRTD